MLSLVYSFLAKSMFTFRLLFIISERRVDVMPSSAAKSRVRQTAIIVVNLLLRLNLST